MAAFLCGHNCTRVRKKYNKKLSNSFPFIKIKNKKLAIMENIDREKDKKVLFSSFLFIAGVAYL